jgi:hypothetical protein
MDRLIGIFSRFQSDSALSCLNDAGRLRGPAPRARPGGLPGPRLLPPHPRRLRHLRRPAGGPVPRASGRCRARSVRSGGNRPKRCAGWARPGSPRPVASSGSAGTGMGITVDGIAKGFIVDRMARTLERRRIRRYLIDAGGDIRAAGRKEDDRPWTVGVRDPWTADHHPDRIHLTAGAVATSGGYERFFDRERAPAPHRTGDSGRSPTESASVSVLAPTGMAADALATGLFLLPPAEALALRRRRWPAVSASSSTGMAGCSVRGAGGAWPRPTPRKGTNDGNDACLRSGPAAADFLPGRRPGGAAPPHRVALPLRGAGQDHQPVLDLGRVPGRVPVVPAGSPSSASRPARWPSRWWTR